MNMFSILMPSSFRASVSGFLYLCQCVNILINVSVCSGAGGVYWDVGHCFYMALFQFTHC